LVEAMASVLVARGPPFLRSPPPMWGLHHGVIAARLKLHWDEVTSALCFAGAGFKVMGGV